MVNILTFNLGAFEFSLKSQSSSWTSNESWLSLWLRCSKLINEEKLKASKNSKKLFFVNIL